MPEAAHMLGVSPMRVRQLIADQRIDARLVAGRWLVDVASLPGSPNRGRPMSQRIAWALIYASANQRPDWIRHDEAHRLRAQRDRLDHDGAPELLARSWLASRGERHALSAPVPSDMRSDPRLVLSGLSDPRAGISAGDYLEAYVKDDALDDVRADHLLVPAPGARANVILHASPVLPPDPVPLLLLAADLADHDSPRELARARAILKAASQADR